jgi:hypothetical protein
MLDFYILLTKDYIKKNNINNKKISIMNSKFFFMFILFVNTGSISAQKKCDFIINYSRIFSNENLEKFVVKLKNEDFIILKDKKEIPYFIQKELDCITGGFSIANPKEKFQSNCIANSDLPKRKLLFLSKSKNILVMTYLIGGFAVSTKILFIEFENEKILDLWSGSCLKQLKSNKEIIKYIQESQKNRVVLNNTKVISL